MIMPNNVASSALLRRWIPGIFRELAAIRTITTTSGGGGGGFSSPESPWLMLQPYCGSNCESIFRFWCYAKKNTFIFYDNEHKSGSRGGLNLFEYHYVEEGLLEVVGSSQGWLAFRLGCDLYLIDPITYRFIQLPPLDTDRKVHSLVLSDHRQQQVKAFVILGQDHRLAFYSPRRRREWTILGDEAYVTAVYSTTQRRLFCITSTSTPTAFKLEAWDVGGPTPRLDYDWVTEFDSPELTTDKVVKYLACAEQSGELFLVARHLSDVPEVHEYEGSDSTVDFEVYKIDLERRQLILMKDSLEGMTMFVGVNHPSAIKDVAGVKPNSVYFTYDKRIGYCRYVAIFDYQNRVISPLFAESDSDFPPYFRFTEFELPYYLPVWFTPRHH